MSDGRWFYETYETEKKNAKKTTRFLKKYNCAYRNSEEKVEKFHTIEGRRYNLYGLRQQRKRVYLVHDI